MTEMQTKTGNRWTLPAAIVAIILLVALGALVADGQADTLIVGGGVVATAVALSALSPVAGIAAVVLAAPTMYDLYPMPRGSFSLLELAILTSTAGIGLRMLAESLRGGWDWVVEILRPAQVVVPVAMIVVATAIALLTLADPGHRAESLREVRTVIVEPILFLLVARLVLRDPIARDVFGWAILLAGTVVGGYAIAQILFSFGGVEAGSVTRATATYTHPNNLALYLERTLLVTLGVGVVRPRWWPVWLLAVVQFAGLALTFSRGALIALAAGVAILLVLRRLWAWLLLLAVGGIGLAGAGMVLFPDRFADAGGSGAEPTRFTIWRASWHMIVDHPLFGVGPDQFLYQYSRRYIEPMGWPERYTSHPHNLVLDTWLRLGVMGLAAMSTLAVGLMWWTKRHVHAIRRDVWAMGALAAIVGGVAHGMVDNGFFLPDLATLTWAFVALLVSCTATSDEFPEHVEPMTTTWPSTPAAAEDAGGGDSGGPRWALWTVAGLLVVLVAAPLLSSNPFVPFVLIATAGLVTVIEPGAGLGVLLATIPIQDTVLLPFVRGELTATQVVLFGFVLGWVVTIYRARPWLDGIVIGYLLVFAAFSISLAQMDEPSLWAAEVYRWMVAGVVYVIARAILRSWRDIRLALVGVVTGVGIAVGYVVRQFYDQSTSQTGLVLGDFRAMGSFNVPNPLAAYIEFTVPVLLLFALLGFRRSLRRETGRMFWLLSVIASGVGLLVIGLTQSRGGYIGMAVALLIVFLQLPRRFQVGSMLAGIVVVGAFAVTPIGQSQVDRFRSALDEEPSPVREVHGGALGRESLWKAGIAMLEDEPLTGIGAGEYDYHYRQYVPEWIDRFPRGQAHDGWIQMGAQAGVPGILAYSIWIWASLLALWNATRRAADDISRLLAWGALAVMLAFTVHSLVDYLNVLSLGIQISAITAMGLALAPDPLPSLQRQRGLRATQASPTFKGTDAA